MKAGDILLFQGDGFLGDGIQLVTKGAYCHAAIAISDTEVVEAEANGVVRTKMVDKQDPHYAVFEVLGASEDQLQAAVKYAVDHIGEKYGYLQDAGYAVNYIREKLGFKRIPDLFAEHGKVICSALVDLAFRSAGIVLRPDRDAGDVTPMGLSLSTKVHLIENHGLWEV